MSSEVRIRRKAQTYWFERHPAAAGAIGALLFSITAFLATPRWRGLVTGPSGWSDFLQGASDLGTLVSAVAVLLSLRYVADQVAESRKQVRLATRQMVATAQQAEEGRHAAVHPELVLKQPRRQDGRPQDWTYIILNPGVAPAIDVRLTYLGPEGIEAIEYRVPVLAVDEEHQIALPPRGQHLDRCLLVLAWKNVLGRQFTKQWEIEILRRGNRTWFNQEDGKFDLYG